MYPAPFRDLTTFLPSFFRMVCLACLLLVSACAALEDEEPEQKGPSEPVEVLYNDAKDLLDRGKFKAAKEAFEEVEGEYPFSEWARRAKLMAGYAAYRAKEYGESRAIVNHYIKLYPAHETAAYAAYISVMCQYDQLTDVRRDQWRTEKARNEFRALIKRYPNSIYARDAKVKLDLVLDHLAGKEMEVGRYYQNRKDYIAAINRYRYVVDEYSRTNHVPEALHRLVESYLSLGLKDDARRSAAVLGYNFPNSPWYSDSYYLLTGDRVEVAPAAEELDWWDKVKSSVTKLF